MTPITAEQPALGKQVVDFLSGVVAKGHHYQSSTVGVLYTLAI